MNQHLTDGELRASLDDESSVSDLHHLETCAECQTRQRQLQVQSQATARKLAFLNPVAEEPVPAAKTIWIRFSRNILTKKETSMLKRWFAFPVARIGAAVVLILALVLAFPGSRAFADELLNLFRVQQVTVIPVDYTGLQQLTGNNTLGSQINDLISSSTTVTQKPGDPVAVTDADQASQLTGFTVRLPQGMTPSEINVTGATAFTFTVDRTKAQALLDEAGRSDLVLPDSIDGAKISVNIPSAVSVGYGTCPKPEADTLNNSDSRNPARDYPDCVILAEVPSPTVDAPADVNVAQLAQIGLEFTGMSSDEAAAFSNSVDWTSTLVVPIPKNAATYEQVTVDGVTGTLIERPSNDLPQYALLWVKDGIVYAISGLGANSQQALDMANSLP